MPGDPTHTTIDQLDAEERRDELERMLGGEEFLATCGARESPDGSVRQEPESVRAERRSSSSRARPGSTGARSISSAGSAGDIAIIDHTDLDRVSAEELLESGVRVVVNVAPSQTGRFPNPGPLTLVRGGVRLIDAPGADLFDQVTDGERLTVRGGEPLPQRDAARERARARAPTSSQRALAEQRARVTEALEAFADNTMRYLRDEGRLLAEGIEFPPLETRFRDRHALVVARGPGHKRDLRIVRPYIRDFKPVLVGVDGGADALLEAGLQAGRDRRRHGLGLRRGAALGRRDRRPRLRGRRRRPARRAASSSACGTTSCRRRG